ncbi:MAG: hypothetical protein JXR91_03575, partial [Deltaproteobacteria bacterium]|nr:hypothetical protein [Deltaproteobacteria bacterium]
NELAGLNLKKPHLFEFTSKQGEIKKIYGKIGESTPFQRDEFVAVLLTSLALGLFFALIIPAYIKSSGIPVKHLQNPLINGAGAFLATMLILLFVSFTLKRGEQLLSSIILLSLSSLMSLTILIFSKHKLLLRLTDFVIQISALFLLSAGGIFFAKSPGLIDIVNSQGGSHFAFFIWRNPFVMVCGILAISILWPVNITGKNQTTILLIAAWIISATGAMIVTAFLLGGWILPGDPYTLDWTTTSVFIKAVLVFAVKTWLVIGASRLISGANRIERRTNAESSRGYVVRWALMLIFAAAAYFLENTHLPQGLIFAQQVLSGGIFFSLLSLLVFKKLIIFYPKNRGAALKIIHKKIIRA